jgi:GT2 family glycosyltransferase
MSSNVAKDIKDLFENSDEEEEINTSQTIPNNSDEEKEIEPHEENVNNYIHYEQVQDTTSEEDEQEVEDVENVEDKEQQEIESTIEDNKSIKEQQEKEKNYLGVQGKVSVIIPTYNRFKYLMNTIKSVKEQTYKDIEIIVINDGSTQQEYYDYDWRGNGIIIMHMLKNTKEKFGYSCVGHVINQGLEIYTGEYFTTCDDDDIWFPYKIQKQLDALKNVGPRMCATEGLIGNGTYNKNKKYPKYNSEKHFKYIQSIYKKKSRNQLKNGFPNKWNHEFIHIHNCIVACSVMIHRSIINKIGKQLEIKMTGQIVNGKMEYTDYNYWLRALCHTNCIYVKDVCFYYDDGHADGKKYL